MAGINVDWIPGYDKPCLNQWYQCKHADEWYKIVKEGFDKTANCTLYKIVSFRSAQNIFSGLTLKQARAAIQIETNKIQNYGG